MRSTMEAGLNPERREGRYSDCFVYVLSGCARYHFKDRVSNVCEGSVLYLPRESTYKIYIDCDYHYIYVDFHFNVEPKYTLMDLVIPAAYRIECKFRDALRYWIRNTKSGQLMAFGCLYEIYGLLLEHSSNQYISSDNKKLAEKGAQLIIEKLSSKNLRVTTIAQNIGISVAHFRRVFKSTYGITPNLFLTQQRVQYAKHLLGETDYSISTISDLSGFCNPYYFSRVFKSYIGLCPSKYREEQLNKK